MKKCLYFFLIFAIVAASGCKKGCDFPKYQNGKYCFDVKEEYLGNYRGIQYDVWSQTPPYQQSQYIICDVLENDGGANSIEVLGLAATVDNQGNITVPNQGYLQTSNFPYHASGSGYFADTIVSGKPNKSITLNLSFTADTTASNGNYTATYFGVR